LTKIIFVREFLHESDWSNLREKIEKRHLAAGRFRV